MAKGRWSRWGRGGCEGYTLDLGSFINFSVIRRSTGGPAPDYFELTSHTRKIKSFPSAKDGMDYAEKELESGMTAMLEDWELYKAHRVKRRKS
ncbi:hypothetical protein [Taklimakanibacter deserti]|uniref:hypothetical protein n=1 Tax=Taklimakanibacter deserti TaxID=2267839 RepID=UPI000E65AA31